MSASLGVPNKRRAPPSIESHLGGLAREYVIFDDVDENVDEEKTNE
jgi:hypothetical protein